MSKYTKYLSKWKRMPLWSRIYHFKEYGYLRNETYWTTVTNNMDIFKQGTEKVLMGELGNVIEAKKERKEWEKHEVFIKKILAKFPELKYIEVNNVFYDEESLAKAHRSQLVELMNFFKEQINKGYTEEEALNMIEDKYRDKIEEKKKNLQVTQTLAINNKVRSQFDIYSQKTEYEARLKVQRIKRDVDFKNLFENDDIPEFTRNIKIVNQSDNYDEDQKKQEEDKVDVDKELREFIGRSKHMLDKFYERAYITDKLGGLQSKELVHRIKDTPGNTKKFLKQTLNILDKHGVHLNQETGEVDLSLVKSKRIAQKISENPLVKYALLQREDQYSFPHLKNQKVIADELRREVFSLRKYERTQKEEYEKQEKKEDVSSAIDKTIGFTYEDTGNTQYQAENKSDTELDHENLKYGAEYRLDQKGTMVESREDRSLKLEERWLRERLAGQSALEQEDEDSRNSIERLTGLIDKIRRVKLKIDQSAMKAGALMFFDEHRVLGPQHMLLEDVPLERLDSFRKLPREHRQMILKDELEFERIKKIVKRKEIVEDLVHPYEHGPQSQLIAKDTNEYRSIVMEKHEQKLKIENQFEDAKRTDQESQNVIQEQEALDNDPKIEKLKGRNADKEDKKKLINFLGKRTDMKKSKAQKNIEKKERRKGGKGK